MNTLTFVIAVLLITTSTPLFAGTSDADFIARREQLGRQEKYRIFAVSGRKKGFMPIPGSHRRSITEEYLRDIAEADFNVASYYAKAPFGLDRVRREARWAQKHGMFYIRFVRAKTGAGGGPKLTLSDDSQQKDNSPNSDVLWDWMTKRILGYAQVSREIPSMIGTFLDFENYHGIKGAGGLYSLSYDAKIFGYFAKAKGITLPELEPSQRKPWLDKQNLQ